MGNVECMVQRRILGTSEKTIVLIITARIYFISPIDLIPDWLPCDFIDDAALITWVL